MVAHESYAGSGENVIAVDGQDIYFYFDRKRETAILNGVNITVKRGTIYSLLGPSGCGKTTLLKCIIGLHKPQTGSLKIYGRSPGSKGFFIPGRGVGYMPQELALYMEMTIQEILTFFGTLYGMSMKNTSERITFLTELLELPNKKKLIHHLSGGQQRRVSFAIALIHKPPLLILDEPTVGVDPLLRKAIWNHLISLAKTEHLAIIITTHYTEEARQAHTVALMRNGHLLEEGNPENLIQKCGSSTLEDVFLKVCEKNDNEDEDCETSVDVLIVDRNLKMKCLAKDGTVSDETVTYESNTNGMKLLNKGGGTLDERNNPNDNTTAFLPVPSLPTEVDNETFRATASWKRLFYLTRKNILRLKRNIYFAPFIVIIAAIQVMLLFLCLSSEPFNLPVAIVNEEEGLNKFGDKFLLAVNNHTICKKPFNNFSLAFESLKNGESSAVLHINSEFSTCLVDRVLEGADASNDTVLCSRITLLLDTSSNLIAMSLRKSIWESYQTFSSDLMISLGKNPLSAEIPVHIEEYPHGSNRSTIIEFAAPALILSIVFMSGISLTEMSLIAERKFGLLSRTLVAGATTTEVLLSFFIPVLVLALIQLVAMLLVAFWAFSLPCNGSMFWVIVGCMLSGICGLLYGFLISSVTDDENAASIVGFGSFFPLLLLSAAFWPLEAMSYYLRYLSYCLPLTRIIESMRSITIRGWSITDNYLWDGYLICSSWSIVLLIFSIVLIKIRN